MLLRKMRRPAITLPCADQAKCLNKLLTSPFKRILFLSSSSSILFLLLYFRFNFDTSSTPPPGFTLTSSDDDGRNWNNYNPAPLPTSICRSGATVFVYDLPAKFNSDLLARCQSLNMHTNMCPYVSNCGLGRPLPSMGRNSWFATNQFLAEMIFHARMENHPCRATEPDRANLFYVPFYGGLHVSSMFRVKNHTTRDALAVELAKHLQALPTWQRHGGADHFIALGRIARDFLRISNRSRDYGANVLLDLPPVRQMSVLTVEGQPWAGSNLHGIPYPSYFHPATSAEMLTWQNHMRESKRPYLFSFIGGPRKAGIRGELIRQCNVSTQCHLLICERTKNTCNDPARVLRVMSTSRFCLQPQGDSFTRRSTFDAVLTGCIPVFFSPHTAYTQYRLYFPADPKEYSVFIGRKSKAKARRVNIEKVLAEIPAETVERMRRKVIDLIPSITYAHPNATELGFRDAVDVAVEALFELVESKLRKTS